MGSKWKALFFLLLFDFFARYKCWTNLLSVADLLALPNADNRCWVRPAGIHPDYRRVVGLLCRSYPSDRFQASLDWCARRLFTWLLRCRLHRKSKKCCIQHSSMLVNLFSTNSIVVSKHFRQLLESDNRLVSPEKPLTLGSCMYWNLSAVKDLFSKLSSMRVAPSCNRLASFDQWVRLNSILI